MNNSTSKENEGGKQWFCVHFLRLQFYFEQNAGMKLIVADSSCGSVHEHPKPYASMVVTGHSSSIGGKA